VRLKKVVFGHEVPGQIPIQWRPTTNPRLSHTRGQKMHRRRLNKRQAFQCYSNVRMRSGFVQSENCPGALTKTLTEFQIQNFIIFHLRHKCWMSNRQNLSYWSKIKSSHCLYFMLICPCIVNQFLKMFQQDLWLFVTTRCCNYSLFELLMMGECFTRNT
jgi:hypothetical protein